MKNNSNNIFYIDLQTNTAISYNQVCELNTEFYPYYYCSNITEFFKNLFTGLYFGHDVNLVDYSLNSEEIERQIDIELLNSKIKCDFQKINFEEFFSKIQHSKSKIGLFTSGTTGKPKLVKHSVENFLKNVRIDESKKNDVWGLCFNPTHMAGLQVILQAFFNENILINLFNKPSDFIFEQIRNQNITHISATPTWFRLLKKDVKPNFTIKHITLGGEKSNVELHKNLNKIFPEAKILNIYASTEAGTLFVSNGEHFTIHSSKIGFVKIENNSIFIKSEILGESEITKKETWYNTGDVVEIITENPLTFKFIGRVDEMINIGGNKVALPEVEEAILSHSEVVSTRIIVKENSVLGKILIAEVQKNENSNLTEKDLMHFLSEKLQAFKIPRMIKFVQNIELTRTGKIKR